MSIASNQSEDDGRARTAKSWGQVITYSLKTLALLHHFQRYFYSNTNQIVKTKSTFTLYFTIRPTTHKNSYNIFL